ncbi:glycosyltransferase family 2 protein [Pontibacter lucknowensis]|uniref:Glycosyltransferase 2-like domain-containing protein n=1 Tax=Pontibacter lucknowensis TaxID=1077936 RepID=A0A1N6Y738_9BACT|nr:glycosyltransferase family 2 protein [Pontibacter lucknowensis]SIR10400.1 hypothetical protein SAMN05421545_2309 [Pontibacter lucknowensis]
MENKPLVSIVTGYYNRKENLISSIESILNQDYEHFEYIIFDDFSDDGTYEMLAEFKDPRLKLIRHSENLGFTKGIIQAISKCNGEYIAIHGAGDVSLPRRITLQVEMLQNNPRLGIVGCLVEDIHQGKSKIHSPVINGKSNFFTQGEVMYLKSLYYKVGGYNSFFKYGQFTHLKTEFCKIADTGYVDEVLYKRIHYKNGVTNNNDKRFEQKFYIVSGIYLSTNDNSLYKLNINDLLLKTYLNVNVKGKRVNSTIFFKYYSGSRLIKYLLKLHFNQKISDLFLKRFLRLFKRIS